MAWTSEPDRSVSAGRARSVPLTIPVGATAQRPRWGELPVVVRDGIQQRLGAAVVEAVTQASGFTPGFASRIRLSDGRRVFVKAADRRIEWLAAAYAREVEVLDLLPPTVPAPRVRDRFDIGPEPGWLVLVFEDVAGRPPRRPWTWPDAEVALAAVESMSEQLTPAPQGLDWGVLGIDLLNAPLDGLREHPLTRAHAADVAALASLAKDRLAGDTLVHSDLRDDNLIISPSGTAWICDWNWPTLGPIWADAACLAIAMIGDGLDQTGVWSLAPTLASADPEAVDSLLGALLAYFVDSAARAPADGSPHLRVHQQWYLEVVFTWLARRRGW